jgi:hypothetical protein
MFQVERPVFASSVHFHPGWMKHDWYRGTSLAISNVVIVLQYAKADLQMYEFDLAKRTDVVEHPFV